MANNVGNAGGAAAAGGETYRGRVVAWLAVKILAEKHTPPLWGLPDKVVFTSVSCETCHAVDDILVRTSDNGRLFLQAKRCLDLGKAEDSDLGKTIRQFVTLYHQAKSENPELPPLSDERDRLILACGPRSSGPVRNHLHDVLDRLRSLTPTQTIYDAAVNENEKRALQVVMEHLKRAWGKLCATPPADCDINAILRLAHVAELNVEADGSEEDGAKGLLKQTILSDSGQASTAWALLRTRGEDIATKRESAERARLQQDLMGAGIALKALPSFRDDIERLKQASERTIDLVSDLAQIQIGTAAVKIARAASAELQRLSETGPLVLVGDPGSGKSGVLHDFVVSLIKSGRDVVLLAADRVEASSLGLLRTEIGLQHDMADVLTEWCGPRAAFLVIDALDATRSEAQGLMLRDLIRLVLQRAPRWNVVVSIRKFDLAHSPLVRQLFAGRLETAFRETEFEGVRHLSVPLLSPEEMGQLESQSPPLYQLASQNSGAIGELLRLPFNLRIAAELLSEGLEPSALSSIQTQLDLLDRYWQYRVLGGAGADAREAILRQVCRIMVDQRSLRLQRKAVQEPANSGHINGLLHDHVLTEWKGHGSSAADFSVLAFPHHVLFDYAVYRLLLRGDGIREVLVKDCDISIVIRPSMLLYFHDLWGADRSRHTFWNAVFGLLGIPLIPQVGRMVGPGVAAALARTVADFSELATALGSRNSGQLRLAEDALQHVVGWLLANSRKSDLVTGRNAGPWCELMEAICCKMTRRVANCMRAVLMSACEKHELLTSGQQVAAGKAARALLEFAWAQPQYDSHLAANAIECICRTYAGDAQASRQLIERCIEPGRLGQYGYNELPRLCRRIQHMFSSGPDMAREVYRAAFDYDEVSNAPTPMGTGQILSMVSNRRQDYRHSHWELAEAFPEFLTKAPIEATCALIYSVEGYVKNDRGRGTRSGEEQTFSCDGQQCVICNDGSSFWDKEEYTAHDDPVRMLRAFQDHLVGLAAVPSSPHLNNIVMILLQRNRSAVVWKRLLAVAAKYPRTLGMRVRELASAKPILTSDDTRFEAGDFLHSIYPLLALKEKEVVERAIWGLAEGVPQGRLYRFQSERNRLLGCIRDYDLVTPEAKALVEELAKSEGFPANEAVVRVSANMEPEGERETLRYLGVPVDDPGYCRAQELELPLRQFINSCGNSAPSEGNVAAVFPALRSLKVALADNAIDQTQCTHCRTALAEACECISRNLSGVSADGDRQFVIGMLLQASEDPDPQPNPEPDDQFTDCPTWSPAPRIEAAQGLMNLASDTKFVSKAALEAIERLLRDPTPDVRYHVARALNTLYYTANEQMWRMVQTLAAQERNNGVWQGALRALDRLASAEPQRALPTVSALYNRCAEGRGRDRIRKHCAQILGGFYIWRNDPHGEQFICGLAEDPAANADALLAFVPELRKTMVAGLVSPVEPANEAVRQRTWGFILSLLENCCKAVEVLGIGSSSGRTVSLPPDQVNQLRGACQLIRQIATELYFGSGAYGWKEKKDPLAPVSDELERFYDESKGVVDQLLDACVPDVADHILQTLEPFITIHPREVFLRIGQVIRYGRNYGYQNDPLGVDQFVGMISRYLAEQRQLFQEDQECRHVLVEVLDVFVESGWPEATRLTYQLEDVFR